jgi:hypothetical protein
MARRDLLVNRQPAAGTRAHSPPWPQGGPMGHGAQGISARRAAHGKGHAQHRARAYIVYIPFALRVGSPMEKSISTNRSPLA